MRYFSILIALLIVPLSLRAAPVPDSLDIATRLAQAGALELALARVKHDQPDPGDEEGWSRWEQLRLTLLSRLKRYEEVLARAQSLPAGAPPELRRTACQLAADAALELKRGDLARTYLARLLWQSELDDNAYRGARERVLESYLVQARPADAYHVMLRLQQDYPAPDKRLLERVIKLLLANGMATQAGTWLPRLDDADPLKLLLRLQAGLVTPPAALTAARSALQHGGARLNWEVIRQVGSMQKDTGLQVEAQEQLLNAPLGKDDGLSAVTAQTLWEAYLEHAQALGNRSQLLIGDDASWYSLALQRLQGAPSDGRALLAYLSGHAGTAALRDQEEASLAVSLEEQKLGLVALRLFKEGGASQGELAADTRRVLGDIAFRQRDFQYAARLWVGLDGLRSGMAPQQWQFVRAYAFLKGGTPPEAERALDALFSGGQPVPQIMTQELLALAGESQEAGQDAKADLLLKRLLASANESQRRRVLVALGRSAENQNNYIPAADYYLQAATLKHGGALEPIVLQAYLAAVENLRRAGLGQDAKAVLRSMQLVKQLSGGRGPNGAAKPR